MYFLNLLQTRFSEIRVNEIRFIQEVSVEVFQKIQSVPL